MNTSRVWQWVTGCFTLFAVALGGLPGTGHAQIQPPISPFIVPPGPPVRIVNPVNKSVFYAPVDVPIFVFTHAVVPSPTKGVAVDFTNVELYATNESVRLDLGPATRLDSPVTPRLPYFWYPAPGVPPLFATRFHPLWCLVWSNAPVGSYTLSAVAQGRYLLDSISRTSPPVNLTITLSPTNSNATNVVSIAASDPIAVAGTNSSWAWPLLPAWTNWPPSTYGTNWGPKPALFSVRRFGDASSSLTVNYSIGGTAGNGVDYAALPGCVTIPAHAAYGLIPIVPADNGSNNLSKTVVLTLAPATNSPAYVIGVPNRAEALILYHWPHPFPTAFPPWPPYAVGPASGTMGAFLSDGGFHINAAGPEGAWFGVQSSADLINWSTVGTSQVIQGSVDFVDPNPPSGSAQFYRVMPAP